MLGPLTSDFTPNSTYDVCVVGAGAAGITLATKLRAAGLSVFLAEGGDLDYTEESQDLYEGEMVGDEYFDLTTARLRYFGGTTNHWGGMCRPLEARDFMPKSVAPQTVWPISREDMDPHLDAVREVLEIPDWPEDQPLDVHGRLRRVHFVFSPPVRFAEKYGKMIADDDGVHACLNCNVTNLNLQDGRIVSAQFENFDGYKIDVNARAFVLACGGIENSRLLLHWNRSYNNALGNSKDVLGRYWMEHPTQTIGSVAFCGDFGLPDDNSDLPISRDRIYLAPTQQFLEDEQILNCRIRLDRFPTEVCEAPSWIARLLGVDYPKVVDMAWVRSSSEQEPVPENRVTLGETVDRFNIPQPVVNWNRSELDRKTFRSVALALGSYFADGTKARLKLDDWVLSEEMEFSCEGGGHCPGGYHHLGGTRMASTPSMGVVDSNCRVFGSDNLFLAGSSVFPSAGYCNPTTTIVQLSIRLASHLVAELKS